MDKSKQPGIMFDKIILTKLNFHRTPQIKKNPELNIAINTNSNISENKEKLQLELNLYINKDVKDPILRIECQMVGFFSVDSENKNMSIEEFSKINAPAQMIPYIREVISNITMRSGINPVILPPINIQALLDNNKEKQRIER